MPNEDKASVPQPKPSTPAQIAASAPLAFASQVKVYVEKQKSKNIDTTLVDVAVPFEYHFTLDDHSRVIVPAGYQSMPRDWAEHWFAISKGVAIAKSEKDADDKLNKGGINDNKGGKK